MAKEMSLPPANLDDFNGYADYYRQVWGLDSIPVSTIDKNLDHKDKRVKWFADWLDYKKASMPQETFEEFKTHLEHSYNKVKGIGLIITQVKYGPNMGYWINFLDGDNEKGGEAILEILGYESIDELKKDCVVEYHPSAPNKFHVYVLSEVPFDNFTLSTDREAIKGNKIPGIEIKGKDSGLAYPTPSLYAADIGKETGERYRLVEGSTPVPTRLFTEYDISACDTRLEELCRRYNTSSFGKKPISELLHPDCIIPKGNYRKRPIIQVGMHYLHEFDGDEDKAEEKTKEWNEQHCDPPLSYEIHREFSDAWNAAVKYYTRDGNKVKKPKESKKDQNIKSATRLVEEQDILWFHDEYQIGYMRIKRNNHFEIFKVSKKDRVFKLFVTKLYYDFTGGGVLKTDELNEVLRGLEAKAVFSDEVKKIHLRKSWNIKGIDNATFKEDVDRSIIFYDMCSPNWTCIMVDGNTGTWELLPFFPENIMFFRYQQRPQVVPKRSGEYLDDILDQWLDKMHITNENDRLLFKVWIVAIFVPDIPVPMLIPSGPQGGAKSTLCNQIQEIFDPYSGDALILPDSKMEAAQQAHHRAILVYDNVDYEVPKWLSNLLCQLVTSATVSKRQLYSDDTDFSYVIKRPVVLNGLDTPKLKADAMDRIIQLYLERISEEKRDLQENIDNWFHDHLADILGKILDTLAFSLKIYPDVKLTRLPRMADFTKRGVSIARAFAKTEKEANELQDSFIEAYKDVMQRQNLDVVESNPIGPAIIKWHNMILKTGKDEDSKEYLAKKKIGYHPGDLLAKLTIKGPQMGFDVKDKDWPKKPFMFVKLLKPIAPDIRHGYSIDINITRDKTGEHGSKNSSWIEISEVSGTNNSSNQKQNSFDGSTSTASTPPPEPKSRSNFSQNGGGLDNLASTEAPLTSTNLEEEAAIVKAQEEVGIGGGGGIAEVGGGSKNSASTKTAQIHAQIDDGGGSGGSGGSFAKTILFSKETVIAGSQAARYSNSSSILEDIKGNSVAVDLEWDNRPGMNDRLFQFNFKDHTGKAWVLNADRDFGGLESELLDEAENTIRNYGVVFTYYEKGDNLGFGVWDKRAKALGKISPINMGKRHDGRDCYIDLVNHKGAKIVDIDLGQVYEKDIIENFLENVYISNELHEVSKALLGRGKFEKEGVTGEFISTASLEDQIKYGTRDAELTFDLAGAKNYAVLSILHQIGRMVDFDLIKMCHTGPTQWWASLFRNKMHIDPSPNAVKNKEKGDLKGGDVAKVEQIKQYRDVAIFDFRGQYPSIITRYNISFETVCCSCCQDNPEAKVHTGLWEIDSKNYWICKKNNKGALPTAIEELINQRDEYKRLKKEAEKAGNHDLAHEYDIKQLACKLMANAGFGVFGEPNFEYGDIRVAQLITGIGRSKVRGLKAKIEGMPAASKLENIYRDTDSAFVIGIKNPPAINKDHPIVKQIVDECSAPEDQGGLGLPLEYQKCYSKVMIASSKNYMGVNADTGKIEVKGLVGKKRNQCKLIRDTFEQQREYWKDDIPNNFAEAQIKAVASALDEKKVDLEKLREKSTIHHDPITGYLKSSWRAECILGRKYNEQKGESISFYLKDQVKDGDRYFTEDLSEIGYNKYKERLRTALKPILTVRGYNETDINSLLKINVPIKKERKTRKKKKMASKSSAPSRGDADSPNSHKRNRRAKTETDIQPKTGTPETQEIQEKGKRNKSELEK